LFVLLKLSIKSGRVSFRVLQSKSFIISYLVNTIPNKHSKFFKILVIKIPSTVELLLVLGNTRSVSNPMNYQRVLIQSSQLFVHLIIIEQRILLFTISNIRSRDLLTIIYFRFFSSLCLLSSSWYSKVEVFYRLN
jgi:hypothetical protein